MIDTNLSVHEVEFVFFDVETTGLSYEKDNIIEVGAIKSTTEKIIKEYSSFVYIDQDIPAEATVINAITNDMLIGAPPITEVLDEFISLIDNIVLVAHNITFDFQFINAELARNNRKPLMDITLVDTLTLAKKIFPNQGSYRLSALAQQFNIAADSFHRALDDAHTCRHLLSHCIEAIAILGDLPLSEIVI